MVSSSLNWSETSKTDHLVAWNINDTKLNKNLIFNIKIRSL